MNDSSMVGGVGGATRGAFGGVRGFGGSEVRTSDTDRRRWERGGQTRIDRSGWVGPLT